MGEEISSNRSIEDVILSHDCRGMSKLRHLLPPSYCEEAARFILKKSKSGNKKAIIATGFFILSAQAPETDGAPGATALGKALDSLGFEVFYVTDQYTMPLLTFNGWQKDSVIRFPITGHEESQTFAQNLLEKIKPAVTISIERCGFTAQQKYLNMRGKDITDFTAKLDYLFLDQENTIGIGDGGNEIGMGNLAPHIPKVPSLPPDPATTKTAKLVISSVSNWGAYGLIAALSRLCQQNLLPSAEWEKELIKELVARGAVDGFTGVNTCLVDALAPEQNAWALTELQKLLQSQMAVPTSPVFSKTA